MNVKVTAIVPSAGSGRRMRSSAGKAFIKLSKKEIICYPLLVLDESSLVSEIIIAAKPENISRIKKIMAREAFRKVKRIVAGGRERADSVFNALSKVSPDTDYVLVHDAARPFITDRLIRKTVMAAKRYGASISAVKVSPTIKESGRKPGLVKKTLDRGVLWEAQTPQVIRRDILYSAYKKVGSKAYSYTDEASLVENMGRPVKIVEGDRSNIKITTPEDLIIAEAILKSKYQNNMLNSKLKTSNSK